MVIGMQNDHRLVTYIRINMCIYIYVGGRSTASGVWTRGVFGLRLDLPGLTGHAVVHSKSFCCSVRAAFRGTLEFGKFLYHLQKTTICLS